MDWALVRLYWRICRFDVGSVGRYIWFGIHSPPQRSLCPCSRDHTHAYIECARPSRSRMVCGQSRGRFVYWTISSIHSQQNSDYKRKYRVARCYSYSRDRDRRGMRQHQIIGGDMQRCRKLGVCVCAYVKYLKSRSCSDSIDQILWCNKTMTVRYDHASTA